MTEDQRRKLWRDYWRGWYAALDAGTRAGYPPQPQALQGLTCGAKTRAGTPCKLTSIYASGRCKLHGGLSTGPKTADGRAKMADNGRQRKGKT
jgi:hypothetical protein